MCIRVRFGSIRILLGAIVAATAMAASSARAGSDRCCNAPPFPEVIYLPQAPVVVPLTGHVLYPLEPVRPFYVVDQGAPASFGAVIYAHPSYSEGGYAFADDYPCVVSYGHGMRIFYRAWRAAATCPPHPYRAARYMDYRRKF
jgi:hypothetical protein